MGDPAKLTSMSPEEKKQAAQQSRARLEQRIFDLDGKRGSRIRSRLPNVPETMKMTFMKACVKVGGATNAIKAYCQNCVGYEDTKNQVGDCHALDCPLWAYRPYQNRAKTE